MLRGLRPAGSPPHAASASDAEAAIATVPVTVVPAAHVPSWECHAFVGDGAMIVCLGSARAEGWRCATSRDR